MSYSKAQPFQQWMLDHKPEIKKVLEIAGAECKVLADTVGEFNPILKIVFEATAMLLNGPEITENPYLVKQFKKLNQKLETVKKEITQISQKIQSTFMNLEHCNKEATINFLYDFFIDFFHVAPEYRQNKKEQFLSQFIASNGEQQLKSLYNAIIDGSILKTVLETERWSLKAVRIFCSALKALFVKGVIVTLFHAALMEVKTQAGDISVNKTVLTKWLQKMDEVEKCLKAAVDECKNNFAIHAKEDMECRLREADRHCAECHLSFLRTKYDWVFWSIRAISPGSWPFNWFADKVPYDHGSCSNFFEIQAKDEIVVISFSTKLTPIDESSIMEKITTQQSTSKMAGMAEVLSKRLPEYAVFTVSRYNNVTEVHNFPDGCYYYKPHGKAHVCIHSK